MASWFKDRGRGNTSHWHFNNFQRNLILSFASPEILKKAVGTGFEHQAFPYSSELAVSQKLSKMTNVTSFKYGYY